MRALVIDDSAVTRGIITQILNPMGFEVFEAGDGREGLDRVRELDRLDLILLDWNMPRMDGIQFLRMLRTQTALAMVFEMSLIWAMITPISEMVSIAPVVLA